MIVLAIDTALGACSAALVDDGATLAAISEPMTRGHQERLAPLVAKVMTDVGFDRLDRVAVTTGPGSFTGLRVGLAFARALALARGVPCIGLNTLEALAGEVCGVIAAAIAAPQGRVYLQVFGAGPSEPALMELDAALEVVERARPAVLAGPGAPLIAAYAPRAEWCAREVPDPAVLARLAAACAAPSAPPAPIYLRPVDALTLAQRAARA